MNVNRPDVAAILARKKILGEVAITGVSRRTAQEISSAFYGWPEEHIDYFCATYELVIYANCHNGMIEIHPAPPRPPAPVIST